MGMYICTQHAYWTHTKHVHKHTVACDLNTKHDAWPHCLTLLTVGDWQYLMYHKRVHINLCTHRTDYWVFQNNCWPEAALSFPFLGPGFLSTSPAKSSRRPKTHARTVTALVRAMPRCATRLRSTGQGWWGVNCGGRSGNNIWDTGTWWRGNQKGIRQGTCSEIELTHPYALHKGVLCSEWHHKTTMYPPATLHSSP